MAGLSIAQLVKNMQQQSSVLTPIMIEADPSTNFYLILNKCAGQLRVYDNEIRNAVRQDENAREKLIKEEKPEPFNEQAKLARLFLSFFFRNNKDISPEHIPRAVALPYDAPKELKNTNVHVDIDEVATTLVIDETRIDLDCFSASILDGLNYRVVIGPYPECELIGVLVADDPEAAVRDEEFRTSLIKHLCDEYEQHLSSDYWRAYAERREEVGILFASCASSWSKMSMEVVESTVKSKNFGAIFEYLDLQLNGLGNLAGEPPDEELANAVMLDKIVEMELEKAPSALPEEQMDTSGSMKEEEEDTMMEISGKNPRKRLFK